MQIYPESGGKALFYLDVSRGAPSYNSGSLFGELTIEGNTAVYTDKDPASNKNCSRKFEFSEGIVKITTTEGSQDCGFGYAVSADNTYKITDKKLPEYFLTGEGDTIKFKGLTLEKYRNR